ncbi:MAG: ABC transporter permease [Kiloniellales bacterium]|nr:ABC transporter permease [Kiloniellales bacterium]
MIRAAPKGREAALAVYPLAMLTVFFLVPFGIMLAVSVFHRVQGGFYEPGFEFASYARFFTPFFGGVLGFSLALAAVTALLCVALGFPFTYFLTRMARRRQVPVLVFLLSVLSLSEVIIGFCWSILLSRTAGLSNLFVALGLLEAPTAWTPGFGALLAGLCYLALPYAVLVLYPALSRLDPELVEAARSLGASPLRTFFTVVVPVLRPAIVAALVMVFVFTLGAYLLPQILGQPQHWTLSVLITDQAIYQSNLPFAAAMAIFLLAVSLPLVGLTQWLGRRRRPAT